MYQIRRGSAIRAITGLPVRNNPHCAAGLAKGTYGLADGGTGVPGGAAGWKRRTRRACVAERAGISNRRTLVRNAGIGGRGRVLAMVELEAEARKRPEIGALRTDSWLR